MINLQKTLICFKLFCNMIDKIIFYANVGSSLHNFCISPIKNNTFIFLEPSNLAFKFSFKCSQKQQKKRILFKTCNQSDYTSLLEYYFYNKVLHAYIYKRSVGLTCFMKGGSLCNCNTLRKIEKFNSLEFNSHDKYRKSLCH